MPYTLLLFFLFVCFAANIGSVIFIEVLQRVRDFPFKMVLIYTEIKSFFISLRHI